MKGLKIIPLLLAGFPILLTAQELKESYVDWGVTGYDFPKALSNWEKGKKWTEDDNFFISRVRPKQRFRNLATQVNPLLEDSIDKKLIYWIPINSKPFNAIPDGKYDSEVFPMWEYITHYGNWTAPLMRMPGNFADVAHKNGVAVSSVASVPWGNISDEWKEALDSLSRTSPEKLHSYLSHYGIDGIGYNSEFNGPAEIVRRLAMLHESLLKLMKEDGNPVAEIIWYDGTNTDGELTFDYGLAQHNVGLWGFGDHIRSSLFFNYNWNFEDLLDYSSSNAKLCGRTPLDLYCSINMQGREPHNSNPEIWTLLAKYPLSIGLWGAHDESMFFESRAEKGPTPEQRQRTYMNRIEKWFSGGNRNPAKTPEFSNAITYGADNDDFFGMTKMMSARSALKWNLSEEPFITYFNLGNGKFLNERGIRIHDREWYNIGIQDYLPTWKWWFANQFLGKEPENVLAEGMKAEFVWDDAWFGGSTVRIHGTTRDEYLHLFKTEFTLQEGDIITFRFKVLEGKGDMSLILSMKGEENMPVAEDSLKLLSASDEYSDEWIEKKFVVGKDKLAIAGSDLAMVAIRFSDSDNLDIRLGEFSIVREKDMSADIDTPVIEKSEVLSSYKGGVDGKIIFNMPNEKEETCYNLDVNTSMFKLYSQQFGMEPQLMGMTTSWAGLLYDAPFNEKGSDKMRFGVSAVTLDHKSESPIAWGDWHPVLSKYEVCDEIQISNPMPKAEESVVIGFSDPLHTPADWSVVNSKGDIVASARGCQQLKIKKGIKEAGRYSLVVQGDSTIILTDRILVQPKDYSPSKGVYVGNSALGFKSKDTGIDSNKSFSISFWIKPEGFEDKSVEMLNIRSRRDPWAKNQWGWFWHTLDEKGGTSAFCIRLNSGEVLNFEFEETRVNPKVWNHVAYVFDVNDEGNILPSLFLNGERQKVTGWTLGDMTFKSEPIHISPAEPWNDEYVVALGGYLHRSGSVRGDVDNFMIWDKTLSKEDFDYAMSLNSSGHNAPKGLKAKFDFEGDADSDGTFGDSLGGTIRLGQHNYRDTEVEGQGFFYWIPPILSKGI